VFMRVCVCMCLFECVCLCSPTKTKHCSPSYTASSSPCSPTHGNSALEHNIPSIPFYNKLGQITSIFPSDIRTLGIGSSVPISTCSLEAITASESTNRETIAPKTSATRSPITAFAVSPSEKGSENFYFGKYEHRVLTSSACIQIWDS